MTFSCIFFQNTAVALVGDATRMRASFQCGGLYVLAAYCGSTVRPYNQSTARRTFQSYARVAVARSSSGWTVKHEHGGATPLPSASLRALAGPNTITYFGLGTVRAVAGSALFRRFLRRRLRCRRHYCILRYRCPDRHGGLTWLTDFFYNDLREPFVVTAPGAVTLTSTAKALYTPSQFPVLGGQYWSRVGKKLKICLRGIITTAATPVTVPSTSTTAMVRMLTAPFS